MAVTRQPRPPARSNAELKADLRYALKALEKANDMIIAQREQLHQAQLAVLTVSSAAQTLIQAMQALIDNANTWGI